MCTKARRRVWKISVRCMKSAREICMKRRTFFTIGDMKDKAAPEKLQGYWILELGELAGLKKVDVETVKAFITRQDDKFRHSYGYSVEDHPR